MIMNQAKDGQAKLAALPGRVEMVPAAGTYNITCTYDQTEIAERLKNHEADYVVVGAILPARSGAELCRMLGNKDGSMQYPVVLMSAADTENLQDRLQGVMDMARRMPAETPAETPAVTENVQRFADIEIHPGRHEVRVKGEIVDLTATEFRLFTMFTNNEGWVFSRDQIIEHIRGKGYSCTPRSVDVLIVGLRRKLGAIGKRIQTVRGVGYRYREQ
jgi:two-component system, OmpR family, alkaline phosphatase synthesis response regulator PhoP